MAQQFIVSIILANDDSCLATYNFNGNEWWHTILGVLDPEHVCRG